MKQLILILTALAALSLSCVGQTQQLEFSVNRVKNLTEMTEKTFPEMKVKINREKEVAYFGKREFQIYAWENKLDSLGRLYLEVYEKPDGLPMAFVIYKDGQFQVRSMEFDDILLYSWRAEDNDNNIFH